jgi:hypothetical protein
MIDVTPETLSPRLRLFPPSYEVIQSYVKGLISRGDLDTCVALLQSGVISGDKLIELGLDVAYNIETKQNYVHNIGEILQVTRNSALLT